MGEDLTLGEVQRNVVRHEREMEAIRTQVTNLAREAVTVTQFAHELGSLRRELAQDRTQMDKLAEERHKATLDKLDEMNKTTNKRLENLETSEANRSMSNWVKAGIICSSLIGLLGLITGIVVGVVH